MRHCWLRNTEPVWVRVGGGHLPNSCSFGQSLHSGLRTHAKKRRHSAVPFDKKACGVSKRRRARERAFSGDIDGGTVLLLPARTRDARSCPSGGRRQRPCLPEMMTSEE